MLDPLQGEQVTAADRTLLPAARHIGDVADMWFIALMNTQTSGAGIELFDPQALSAHGGSWTQVHTRLGMLDISDPARPGQPLVHVPFDAWDTVTWQSLWTDRPGFTYQLKFPQVTDAQPVHDVRVTARYGRDVGGGAWVPRHVFDRDPATDNGAPSERRALQGAYEASVVANTRLASGPLRLVVEGIRHAHHYITLAPEDGAQRTGVMLAHHLDHVGAGADLVLMWQGQRRDFEGAQFRWPQDLTFRTHSQGVIAQGSLQANLAGDVTLRTALGFGWRSDAETPNGGNPMGVDVQDQWMWMARPRFAQDLQRFRVDGEVAWDWHSLWELRLRGNVSGVEASPHIVGGRTAEILGTQAVRQTLWREQTSRLWWQSGRAEAVLRPPWDVASIEAVVAVDATSVNTAGALGVTSWTPALGVACHRPWGPGEIFALARREPLALDPVVTQFLDTRSPSGTTYGWQDPSGHLDVAQGVLAPALARHGGDSHVLDTALRRSTSNQVALGYRTAPFGPFRFVIQGVGRWIAQRYTVRLAQNTYSAVPYSDPGGGHEISNAYAQDLSAGANQTYILTNDDKLAFYTGTEFQLYTETSRRWFMNLGGAAYISAGGAPFGSFPDRNDPGVVDESSATPNQQINAFGRYDHDRSFTIKWLAGFLPLENLSIAVAARYRDGQPFARLLVPVGLPQGPEVLMAQPRGRVRHTFAMTWDLRVRYALPIPPYHVAVGLDVYNVWGSATEILEDPRSTPSFRNPLEVLPDRAVLVTLDMTWAG